MNCCTFSPNPRIWGKSHQHLRTDVWLKRDHDFFKTTCQRTHYSVTLRLMSEWKYPHLPFLFFSDLAGNLWVLSTVLDLKIQHENEINERYLWWKMTMSNPNYNGYVKRCILITTLMLQVWWYTLLVRVLLLSLKKPEHCAGKNVWGR